LLETDISLVEHCPTGSVVASGNLATADEDPAVAEIGVLVEDGWQGLGLCAALLRQLVAGARMAGFGEVAVRLGLAPHHRGMLGRAATQTPRTLVSRSGLA